MTTSIDTNTANTTFNATPLSAINGLGQDICSLIKSFETKSYHLQCQIGDCVFGLEKFTADEYLLTGYVLPENSSSFEYKSIGKAKVYSQVVLHKDIVKDYMVIYIQEILRHEPYMRVCELNLGDISREQWADTELAWIKVQQLVFNKYLALLEMVGKVCYKL